MSFKWIKRISALNIQSLPSVVVRSKHELTKRQELLLAKKSKHWSSLKARRRAHEVKTKEQQEIDDDPQKDDFEDPHETILNADKLYELHKAEMEERREITRFKMTERKFFRPKPEPSLLSWSAREQLRYLHHIDPKQWTVQELAKRFPISEEGVKKILKSKFSLKTPEEIARYDQRVKENWREKKMEGGPINAPRPKKEEIEKNLSDVGAEKKRVGYFSSILTDTIQETTTRDEHMTINDFDFRQKNKYAPQITAEEFLKQNKIEIEVPSKTLIKKKSQETVKTDESEIDNYEVEGKFQKYQEQNSVNLKYGVRKNQQIEEAYLYDDKFGYQQPLGKIDDIPEKIRVDPKKIVNGIIKVGDKYYDDNGEFLYRVPGMTK